MKKFALCFLLMLLAIGVCATGSYSDKPLDPNFRDIRGIYEGTITRYNPSTKTADFYGYGTIVIFGKDENHFWGNVEIIPNNGEPYCYPLNGIIVEDNTIYYTAGVRSSYGKFIPAKETTTKRIETVTLRPESDQNSSGSYTYTGPAPEPYTCTQP